MLNRKMIFLVLTILAVMAAVFYSFRSVTSPLNGQGEGMLKFKNFEAKNPTLDFTFEYPETGWVPAESQGRMEKYDLVYLRGPVDEKTKFATLIHITVRPLGPEGKASGLLEAYLKVDSNLSKFEVLQKNIISVGGEEAFWALCKYEAIPSHDISVPPVAFKKQMVFVVKNGHSYEFTLNTFASQYNSFAPVLGHILKTFKFKN